MKEYSETKTEKAAETPKKKKFGKRELMLILIPAAAAVIAVIVASLFVKTASKQKTSKPGHQYYMNAETPIEGGTVIKKSDDGTATYIDTEAGTIEIADLPIYYDDEEKFMITEDMVYFDPRSGRFSRADKFTEFYMENDNLWASIGGVKQVVNSGFLYNGKDMYIFLEPVTVTADRFNQSIPTFSYVEAVYGDQVAVFDYKKKKTDLYSAGDDVPAKAVDYTVNVVSDTVILPDGMRILLFNAPDQLKPLISAEK